MRPTSSAMAELLARQPATFQETLGRLSGSISFRGTITVADAEHVAQQLGVTVHQIMLDLLPFAALYAEPVISNFKVGAVAQGLSGNLYFGANIEFKSEALSLTVHAEQAAVMNAWMQGETGLLALAVSAAPCGYCRQFLFELVTAETLKILLPNTKPTLLTWFLPDAFGPHNLGVRGGLMQAENQQLTVNSQDPLVLAALAAANMSYAPYSLGYSGVALATADGGIYAGAYAESAAFNPSMSPMEATVSQLNVGGVDWRDIQRAVLVEVQNGVSSQVHSAMAALSSISGVPLETCYATASPHVARK
ncbi:MAG: cytidine deaminase [Acidobacteria bacterium]|nr:MAG: cytidine deaminase [Acidobacteriota bacterium]